MVGNWCAVGKKDWLITGLLFYRATSLPMEQDGMAAFASRKKLVWRKPRHLDRGTILILPVKN